MKWLIGVLISVVVLFLLSKKCSMEGFGRRSNKSRSNTCSYIECKRYCKNKKTDNVTCINECKILNNCKKIY